MTTKVKPPPKTAYLVRVGLTRRLVKADTPEEAKTEFVKDRLMRSFLGDLGDVLEVRPATDAEVEEFTGRKRKATFDGQGALVLDDLRQGYGEHDVEHRAERA